MRDVQNVHTTARVVRSLVEGRVVNVAAPNAALDHVLAVTRASFFMAFGVFAVGTDRVDDRADDDAHERDLRDIASDARPEVVGVTPYYF
jgi:hypothetical protein